MDITANEMQMYMVMKSIYDSGIPICFKGSMVLNAFLNESGFTDNVRQTVDIDANWYFDEPPTSEQMVASLQSAIDHSKLQIDVKIVRMYGNNRSAGFVLMDRKTNTELFSMDIDVNRPMPESRLYEIAGLRFYGVSPTQIIADKICAVSTNKVFRRIKDVIDLY
ncbi:MAG: nucleotidyl transferase AbiEii/AbiGii toxin family protein [Clostridia bacterium]|nr:nucleotidyl transferase AbiEii/AbiGii toxin family protein [Clostridia bacterium]MBQ5957160.1 nucleotidyl transferase AbiEii/AbiGii toxin family protein [Clostridia bacterium]MBR6822883.1 nucleotidyl transferase AbiEii/AbiGii toxin family protein [Clostridia bacterium]